MSLEKYTKDRIDELIYDAIDTIRGKKHKIPDEISICSFLNTNTEKDNNIITKRIQFLLETSKLRNKPTKNGGNSYFRIYAKDPEALNLSNFSCTSIDSNTDNKSILPSSPKLPDQTPLPPTQTKDTPPPCQTVDTTHETPFISHPKSLKTPPLSTTVTENEMQKEIISLKEYIKSLENETHAIKLFIEEQLHSINNTIKNIENNETLKESNILIEHLQHTVTRLEQENDSKTTIIKILAENSAIKSSSTTNLEKAAEFNVVKSRSNKKQDKTKDINKPRITCSNRYDLLYQTDSENEDSSSDETTTESESTSNVSSSEKSTRNKNKRKYRKKKKNITKVTESNQDISKEKDNAIEIKHNEIKKNVESQPAQQQKVRQNITSTYSGILNNKAENILILSDSMLKTLRMREFNRLLKGKGIAHLKAFPGAKAKQLKHHSIPILEENNYDSTIIHVGINDLLKSPEMLDSTNVVDSIIDIGLNCRNYNISNIFISSIVYCEKIDYDFQVNLNKRLHEECVKNGFIYIDNKEVTRYDLWKDGVHMIESGKNIVANNIIDSIKNFLGYRNHPIRN